jgi:hypothetical protein
MAAVYTQLTRSKKSKDKDVSDKVNGEGAVQNKQRVLMLSSRGITHRYVLLGCKLMKATTFDE